METTGTNNSHRRERGKILVDYSISLVSILKIARTLTKTSFKKIVVHLKWNCCDASYVNDTYLQKSYFCKDSTEQLEELYFSYPARDLTLVYVIVIEINTICFGCSCDRGSQGLYTNSWMHQRTHTQTHLIAWYVSLWMFVIFSCVLSKIHMLWYGINDFDCLWCFLFNI